MSSVEEDDSGCELDAGEEISGELVVTRGYAAEVLELVEEALDEVALALEREIAGAEALAVGLGRDHRGDAPLGQAVDEPIGVEGLVADQSGGVGRLGQRFCACQIMRLARREHQFDGIAQGIDERVDFGGQSAARAADGLRFAPFFRAPALC